MSQSETDEMAIDDVDEELDDIDEEVDEDGELL